MKLKEVIKLSKEDFKTWYGDYDSYMILHKNYLDSKEIDPPDDIGPDEVLCTTLIPKPEYANNSNVQQFCNMVNNQIAEVMSTHKPLPKNAWPEPTEDELSRYDELSKLPIEELEVLFKTDREVQDIVGNCFDEEAEHGNKMMQALCNVAEAVLEEAEAKRLNPEVRAKIAQLENFSVDELVAILENGNDDAKFVEEFSLDSDKFKEAYDKYQLG